ncbi:hypothetical protein P2318_30915 [Myxococcaceae bacterium GXIMD 01537]
MKKLLLTAVLSFASTAGADIPPPNTSACTQKEAGSACETEDGKSGTCQTSKCSRNDYSNGVPPTVREYECLQCVAGEGTPSSPSTTATASPTSPEKKSGSCAAMPGAPLAASALWVGWLARRRKRAA